MQKITNTDWPKIVINFAFEDVLPNGCSVKQQKSLYLKIELLWGEIKLTLCSLFSSEYKKKKAVQRAFIFPILINLNLKT